MEAFQVFAAVLVLTAAFSYVNHRYLRLPTSVGVMIVALVSSLLFIAIGHLVPEARDLSRQLVEAVDFDRTVLHGMLGYLLFAGALHIDLVDLKRHRLVIGLLATAGVVLSTAIVGGLLWALLQLLHAPLPITACLLFGALISPTDPIAVLAILKPLGKSDLRTQIAGESLLNDGVGVVLFVVLLEIARAEAPHLAVADVAVLLLREVIGGAVFGIALGWIANRMLRSIDNYQVEILISLALVTGGFALADAVGLSAPIAMVAAGLLVGTHGRRHSMSETTRRNLDLFWELVDDMLNAVLFVLIGLEVLVLTMRPLFLIVGLVAVAIVLLARFVSTGLLVSVIRSRAPMPPNAVRILTWTGLRGGISVAMALSLKAVLGPTGAPVAEMLLVVTYVVVVFSVLVQGTSARAAVRRWTAT